MLRTHTVPAARALAFLRMVTGAWLFAAGAGKMTIYRIGGVLPLPVTALQWQVDFPTRLAVWLSQHPDGVLAAIVRDLLLPRGALVAGVVAWSQLLAGVLLVLGLRTRFAAALSAVVALALTVSAGWRDPNAARLYAMLGALSIALFIGGAGDTLGLDGWRRERRRDRDL